jgi:hypothetical protein
MKPKLRIFFGPVSIAFISLIISDSMMTYAHPHYPVDRLAEPSTLFIRTFLLLSIFGVSLGGKSEGRLNWQLQFHSVRADFNIFIFYLQLIDQPFMTLFDKIIDFLLICFTSSGSNLGVKDNCSPVVFDL